jgi:hypothetical protein
MSTKASRLARIWYAAYTDRARREGHGVIPWDELAPITRALYVDSFQDLINEGVIQ